MGQFHKAVSGIDHLERLGRGHSPVHHLPAVSKITVTFVFIVFVISFPMNEVSGLIPFAFYPAILMSLSETPWKPMLSRTACALPFALAIGISNLILLPQTAFHIGGLAITFGMVSFASIMVKTALCVFAVLLLIATTPFTDIAALLTAAKGVRVIGLQIVLTYRYISTLLEEAGDMMTAYRLRSGGLKALKMKDMGPFCGQLLLRSFDQAERVYYAMKCRLFNGVYYGGEARTMRGKEWLLTLCACAVLCALRFFNVSRAFGALLGRI